MNRRKQRVVCEVTFDRPLSEHDSVWAFHYLISQVRLPAKTTYSKSDIIKIEVKEFGRVHRAQSIKDKDKDKNKESPT